MWRRPSSVAAAVALMVALSCAVARGDDGHKPPEDPDAGFLEFLGSVDRLADVNPEYLGQAEARSKPAPAAIPPAPPPPPPRPPQAPNGTGGHNNG